VRIGRASAARGGLARTAITLARKSEPCTELLRVLRLPYHHQRVRPCRVSSWRAPCSRCLTARAAFRSWAWAPGSECLRQIILAFSIVVAGLDCASFPSPCVRATGSEMSLPALELSCSPHVVVPAAPHGNHTHAV
jgi:hypothetical protein